MGTEFANKFLVTITKELKVLAVEERFLVYLGLKKLNTFEQIVCPEDLARLRELIEDISKERQDFTCFRVKGKNKKYNWVSAHIESLKTSDQQNVIRLGINDIQGLEEDISESDHDAMTGVYNKQTIMRKAHILAAKRPYEDFCFCIMDIDNFKSVNDVYGHMRGDEVIIDVAHAIQNAVEGIGIVGRFGGDEFMVLLEHVGDEQTARYYLQAMRAAAEELYAGAKDGLTVTVTIGAVLFPAQAHNYEELFHVADKMLYIGKMKGRNRYIIYTPEIHGNVLNNDKVSDASYRKAVRNKIKMMSGLLERLLHGDAVTVREIMRDAVCYYNLDGMYLFYDGDDTSVYGMAHEDGNEDSAEFETMDMDALYAENIERYFNENGIAILDFHEMKRDYCCGIYDYMEERQIRYMIICRIERAKRPGNIVYVNRRENSRKFADSDVTDLTSISKILEVVAEKEQQLN